jgi:hypothetical protein
MGHDSSGGWRTFAVYHRPDGRDVCVRAESHPGASDPERAEVELWTNYRWGNCWVDRFRAALIQAPLRAAAAPAHLLALVLPGARYGLKLPIRFAALIPDDEFDGYGFDGFALYRAGVFCFADRFDPGRSGLLDPARPPAPGPGNAAGPADDMRAALAAGDSVVLQAECLTPEDWPPLEGVWAGCPIAVRRGAALLTQTFAQDLKALDWCLACQFAAGRSWAQGAADWKLVRAHRPAGKSPGRPGDSGARAAYPTPQAPPRTPPPAPPAPRPGSGRGLGLPALLLAAGAVAFAGWREAEYQGRARSLEAEVGRVREEIARRPGPDEPLPARWSDTLLTAQAKSAASAKDARECAEAAAAKAEEARRAAADALAGAQFAGKHAQDAAVKAREAADAARTADQAAKEAAKRAEQAAASAKAAYDAALKATSKE